MTEHTLLSYLLFTDICVSDNALPKNTYAMKSCAHLAFCNRVFGTIDTKPEEIEVIKQFFGSIPFTWFVPQQDKQLSTTLEQAGFTYKISFPAMTASLNEITLCEYAPGIRVEQICAEALPLWISLVTQAYGITAKEEFETFVRYLIRCASKNLYFYIGYYNQIPVAASMVIDHPHAAALHWVGTLPTYRGKGLGFAVSHYALLDAKKRDQTNGILFASKAGEPIYKKFGFTEYNMYNIYG